MRWLAVLLLLAAPVLAQGGVQAYEDTVHRVDVRLLDYLVSGCDSGDFEIDAERGRFRFVDRFDEMPAGLPGGHYTTGCGSATFTSVVPEGASQVVVDFFATREVDSVPNVPESGFVQEVRLLAANGRIIARVPYYNDSAGADPAGGMHRVALPLVGENATRIVWYFEDLGFTTQGTINPASGTEFASTVGNITVTFASARADWHQQSDRGRDGSVVRTVHDVVVNVDAADSGNVQLRVVVSPDWQFRALHGPGGATLRDVGSDASDVRLIERVDGREREITLPAEIIMVLGPGTYRFEFQDVQTEALNPVLRGIAAAVGLVPMVFGLAAFLRVRRFEQESFGHFRSSARRLRLAVVVVFAYYGAVMASAFAGARIDSMAIVPPPAEGWLMYLQLVVASTAFITLWLVARELAAIVDPPAAEMPRTEGYDG